MTEKTERLFNSMIVFFDRFVKGTWFLDKKTLQEFICNRRVCGEIHIGLVGAEAKDLKTQCERFNYSIDGGKGDKFKVVIWGNIVHVKLYPEMFTDYIKCKGDRHTYLLKKEETMSNKGTWRYNVQIDKPYSFPVPYKMGSFLDTIQPGWFLDFKHKEPEETNDRFFVPKRVKNAIELMGLLHECAEEAGFRESFFPGFGTLLGIVREGGFISGDTDMDHCIMGPHITKDQEDVFLYELGRSRKVGNKVYPSGLWTGRERAPQRRKDNGRLLWTSCGHKKISAEKGVKSCVWKFFEHYNIAWHSKGGKWVNPRKFTGEILNFDPSIQAVAKGMPARFLSEFTTMKFKGININVPKLAGHCLDAWYPGWARPKKDKSAKDIVMIIPKWKNPKGWKQV
ncbi:MAG TPA: hypothetical protein VMV77_05245 [Bacteroidales bacterium]|nr:hypothetical protein [Bacteroidales bacterium]